MNNGEMKQNKKLLEDIAEGLQRIVSQFVHLRKDKTCSPQEGSS